MAKQHQSYGMTHEQVEKNRIDQLNGVVREIPANNLDNVNDKLFKEDFKDLKISEHEKGIYHLGMESRSFTPRGERVSVPYVQKFSKEDYAKQKRVDGFNGFDVVILHDPTKESESVEDEGDEDDTFDVSKMTNDTAKKAQEILDGIREEQEKKQTELEEREAKLLRDQEEFEAQKNALKAQQETQMSSSSGGEQKEDFSELIKGLPENTVMQLQQIAADHGIDLTGITLKADIITTIKKALK